jgi:AraC-like DNA-binding protein
MLHGLQETRDSTLAARWRAIERVVDTIQHRLDEPMTLRQMARIALMSPYHFNRVFRGMTGLPPRRFLTALRIEAAKRLLLQTDMSVTSVCFEVGYESLGSFITRFSQQVGTSPRALRQLARETTTWVAPGAASTASDHPGWPGHADEEGVRGRIVAAEDRPGFVFFGLFAGDAPHGRPIRCGCRRGPGEFVLNPVPDGRWHLFAASFPDTTGLTKYLLPDMGETFVAEGAEPVCVVEGRCDTWCELTLRRARPTDPPILAALMPFPTSDHQPDDCHVATRRRRALAEAALQ